MSVAEIAAIQGFPVQWVEVDGTTDSERIAVLGNAVPPPLSHVIAQVIHENIAFQNNTLIEICAGIGGLSSGFDYLSPIAKIELWDVAAQILRSNKSWPSECVVEGYAQQFDYAVHRGKVGLLCGGPPCQPWSMSGRKKGAADPRDVMGFTPVAIAECEPEVFLFENVPGLLMAKEHKAYVNDLFERMCNPKEGLRYGLAVMVFNAADFGVPQIRKRVLMLGIKGKSNMYANKILKKIQDAATHHDPSKPAIDKLPWVTLRQAFEGIPVTEPWKQWNATDETLKKLEIEIL
jgi:DNA-cytosine methyltransferase